ncbi:hypothetical protein IQ270_25130 [Microcoleus sp. LEGE 07076]|uniref:hypothetical protein n=1 Tax=Microcoleus sp. LEGE 07076 TaxID=915322 RepID=UPI001882E095|nr:hypothetical protein [Microcoleus sp. LEGE 07076]MBE9187835.1 hypothetical protein [Microcoleus sp. LEGE 07076]
MAGGIYLIQDDDRLVEMMEQPYDSEDQLQDLLVTYPNLIAGDQIDRATARKWLLISREAAAPADEETAVQWSLDHLFLDQNAVPTLVDVRRTPNAELRQKVLGQSIDYAANAVVHWPVDSIIAMFEANCRDRGRDPEQIFEEFLGADANEDRFWQKVKTNLQAGKIRLVFVADEISAEMRRVVEFLNEQMDPVEVFALEIKQYVSEDGLKTLVPRVIGQTAEAQQKKSSATRERRRWDESSFFAEIKTRGGAEEAQIAKAIYAWVKSQAPFVEIQWGTGDTYGGFAANLHQKSNKTYQLFTVNIAGKMEISAHNYGLQQPFNEEKKWLELRSKLSSIGLSLPTEPGERRSPSLALFTLQDESAIKQVIETFEWVIQEIKKA